MFKTIDKVLTSFLESRNGNIIINLLLFILCFISYILLIVIFCAPQSLRLESLVYVNTNDSLQPSVAVNLLATLLVASTSALATRCVEQSLWLKLASQKIRRPITAGESYRLAQWSVSPMARLGYFFTGASWLLKVGGILLIAGGVLSPILLIGVTQKDAITTTVDSLPRSASSYVGFTDNSNALRSYDVPTTIASLASMQGLNAPSVPTCESNDCLLEARAPCIRAECSGKDLNVTEGNDASQWCSTIDPDLCVSVYPPPFTDGAPGANFTTDYPPSCDSTSENCKFGEWATILGVFYHGDNIHVRNQTPVQVDCRLLYGTILVRQNGTSAPSLDRSTFIIANNSFDDHGFGPRHWREIYRKPTDNSSLYGSNIANPYAFVSGYVKPPGNYREFAPLAQSPVGWMLLGPNPSVPAADVARRIEANWDATTLFAFARSPASADQTVTTIISRAKWEYQPLVLFALLLPLLATMAAAWGRIRVEGKEVCVGYDPVEIARRGPVLGVTDIDIGAEKPTKYEQVDDADEHSDVESRHDTTALETETETDTEPVARSSSDLQRPP